MPPLWFLSFCLSLGQNGDGANGQSAPGRPAGALARALSVRRAQTVSPPNRVAQWTDTPWRG